MQTNMYKARSEKRIFGFLASAVLRLYCVTAWATQLSYVADCLWIGLIVIANEMRVMGSGLSLYVYAHI